MLSPAAKRTVLAHPELFILHYFGDRIEVLKDFHLELIELATTERRGLELYPATHGKTTIISEILPIWAICKDPNIRIAGLFKNDQDARAIVRSIQAELQGNDELIADFGPFMPKWAEGTLWTQTRFDVDGRTRPGKSSTFAAFGAGSRGALGYRSDWVIADDVVTDRNSSTEDQRANLSQWFMQGPMTSPDSDQGRITVVGTAFHPQDLYHQLMEIRNPHGDGKLWKANVQRAIVDEEKQEVLWPESRPYSFLMEQKEAMGTLDFNKRFQNVARDASDLVFREEHVRGGYLHGEKFPGCLDDHYKIGVRDPDWKVYNGFDPAVGVYRGSKFCALIVLAVGSCKDHEKCWWVVDIIRDQMTLPQQVEAIIYKHQEYDAYKTMIEANVYQAGLYQQVQQKMEERNIFLTVEPHYTTRTNKPDPDTGVQAMSTMVSQGRLHIPWGDAASRAKMTILVDEMITYPGKTTDTVMSMWFSWRETQVSAPRFKAFNRLSRVPRYDWPRPTPYGTQRILNPYYEKPEPDERVERLGD
jgi:hypothetical protein